MPAAAWEKAGRPVNGQSTCAACHAIQYQIFPHSASVWGKAGAYRVRLPIRTLITMPVVHPPHNE
ncbi:uncharacterized protein LY89DRAFT_685254 [Mollisia scopiformis]|uniref:Uncharacterized protein n=1 Tax=Mollisia scopiformis TaxID=149040 RepID=A0A194X7S5_MOLSC|nr:uncharacterized protein LY89DRAFT_685254 [Mollisia scopiformis]KUJ16221.1 hypothetical protein LY89DRAFT_685254 [Mollisia scopiformis]